MNRNKIIGMILGMVLGVIIGLEVLPDSYEMSYVQFIIAIFLAAFIGGICHRTNIGATLFILLIASLSIVAHTLFYLKLREAFGIWDVDMLLFCC